MVIDGKQTLWYLFVKKLSRITTEDVCKQLRVWLLDFGWFCAIRTDGGSQFHEPFIEFCNANCVEHELSLAYNQGLAVAGEQKSSLKNFK